MKQGLCLFDTPLGRCGIAWGERGLVGTQLPEVDERRTLARLRRRYPELQEALPPEPVSAAIDSILALLRGEPRDLREIVLDTAGLQAFALGVYELARAIPPGQTRTYGELATALGDPGAARAVGRALGANPFPIVVPCHRILGAGDWSGGFSAHGGVETKKKLLFIESGGRGQQELF
ncbi:methylated-DNA--[protein]-cysteine S-methyltransferase [Solimonas sp. K1W22B-7]|uniref:methylated-DNA--[protein]-cysteine S-methyltransferase n=1 Tax=Solimonas sp. K1W22B-7 TaxID=2303331 RepID=UPI000E32E994|nr:methylated-DNA--[protein]-cysteine S-methyltransferase [Solimonas sp. K1W22B-7]AXQ31481.1 methylated-DNA--[protein]-cysteine S-methyltransferase [Solimonas sp. K1W22B-7]